MSDPTTPKDDAPAATEEPEASQKRTSGTRRSPRGQGAKGSGKPAPDKMPDDLPDRINEGRPKSAEAAEKALVRRKPQIGDTLPAPPTPAGRDGASADGDGDGEGNKSGSGSRRRRRRGGRGRGGGGGSGGGGGQRGGGQRGGGQKNQPIEALTSDDPVELDEDTL